MVMLIITYPISWEHPKRWALQNRPINLLLICVKLHHCRTPLTSTSINQTTLLWILTGSFPSMASIHSRLLASESACNVMVPALSRESKQRAFLRRHRGISSKIYRVCFWRPFKYSARLSARFTWRRSVHTHHSNYWPTYGISKACVYHNISIQVLDAP